MNEYIPSFEQIFENKPFLKYKNKFVVDTKHSIERNKERLNLTDNEIQTIFKRGIDTLLKKGYGSGDFLLFSKEFNQGFVIDYRPSNNKRKENDLIVITTLPKDGTTKLVLERYNDSPLSIELVNYLNQFISSSLKESLTNVDYETIKMFGFNIVICNNKIWEVEIGLLEVE
jgi:hypothetical protein